MLNVFGREPERYHDLVGMPGEQRFAEWGRVLQASG